ncbi:hypothetical protein ACFL67_01020 [candidate division KSB1 bacterium]
MNIDSKKIISITGLAFLFILILQFGVLEMIFGTIIDITNGMRDQSGAVWERYLSRKAAAEQLGILGLREEEDRAAIQTAGSFGDIVKLLDQRESVIVDKTKFLELFRNLTRAQAERMIPALELLKIDADGSLRRCYFMAGQDEITIIYLNEMNDLLYRSVVTTDIFSKVAGPAGTVLPAPARFMNEAEMTVSREQFLLAYNDLPTDAFKVEIINDPFKLIMWGERLQRVAILPERYGSTPVIFEVRKGADIFYEEFSARTLAADHLIEKLRYLEEIPIR